jgi:hypothetical protein
MNTIQNSSSFGVGAQASELFGRSDIRQLAAISIKVKIGLLNKNMLGHILLLLASLFSAGLVNAQDHNYPQSNLIKDITFGRVVRSFGDGDNFPTTWADDGNLYTMFNDGTGFSPNADKLSNGFAKLDGTTLRDIEGINVSSPDISFVGSGKNGRKTGGLISVDGVLYALMRNLNNDGTGMILMWSDNKGESWQEGPSWNELSIGDFVNMGQDYSLAQDEYVYFIGHNGNDAYKRYDSFMMARVPKDQITNKSAYTYYAGANNGEATWAANIQGRKPVFQMSVDNCYRPSLTYIPGKVDRYLLMFMPHSTAGSYQRYLGVFEAPNPWGPWSVVKEVTNFPVYPDKNDQERRYHPRIPTKWISDDGLRFMYNYSVFRGNGDPYYKYNLQRARIVLF